MLRSLTQVSSGALRLGIFWTELFPTLSLINQKTALFFTPAFE